MKFASTTITSGNLAEASRTVLSDIEVTMEGKGADLALLFFSPHFADEGQKIANELVEGLGLTVLLGCTAAGVIGKQHEIEDEPGLAILAAHLPDVKLSPFVLEEVDWDQLVRSKYALIDAVAAPEDTSLFVMVGDPYSTPMVQVLEAFNSSYPMVPIVGGMASSPPEITPNLIILNDRQISSGVAGVALSGEIEIEIIVSQGCRPIGRPFSVTSAHRNLILGLDNSPPLAQIETLVNELPEEDRRLLQNGLFVGKAIDSDRTELGRGDYLIRSLMQIDQASGAIAIGDNVEEGETIQFHLRDATTAVEDLEMLLSLQSLHGPASGALLFSCNGRGRHLYDHPDGDISVIQKSQGDVELAGFFCAGEIGPIGGRNFLHGHTASLALFRQPGHRAS